MSRQAKMLVGKKTISRIKYLAVPGIICSFAAEMQEGKQAMIAGQTETKSVTCNGYVSGQ
jgi:hypothetical protein